MDARMDRIGEHAATHALPWAVNTLGPVSGHPLDRLDWQRRAASIGAWRELSGYDHRLADTSSGNVTYAVFASRVGAHARGRRPLRRRLRGRAPCTGHDPGIHHGRDGHGQHGSDGLPWYALPARAVWAAQDGRGGRAQVRLHMISTSSAHGLHPSAASLSGYCRTCQ